jgi:hypothetical protein
MSLKNSADAGTDNTTSGQTAEPAWQVDSGVLSEPSSAARWLILLFSVLLIILGIFRGEVAAVFRKAATICLECIGIG